MKTNPLQNPRVVLALVAAAAGALFFQFRPALPAPHSAKPAKTATAKRANPPANQVAAADWADPGIGLDSAFFQQRLAQWVDSPHRDPFGFYPKSDLKSSGSVTNASEVLHLTAIWRQTGQRLAVINKVVVAEGADILGYRLEQIEGHQVRVSGPRGLERVALAGFDASSSSPGNSNTAPAVATVPPGAARGG